MTISEATPLAIPDIQASGDTRRIPINKVGIKAIRHPIHFADRAGQPQPTVAHFDMYVDLAHDTKGTHMSRFVDILNSDQDALSVRSFEGLLERVLRRLEAERAYVDAQFTYFVSKRAPVSGVASLMDYDIRLSGEATAEGSEVETKVLVPVTSLCPCSKEISEYGAHNQRSHVTVAVRTREPIWVEDLIELAESQASCELYGLLKRPDEKYVTERAYDNPKFVEDMVRDVAGRLKRDERVLAFRVESENFESIHNHSAYAMIELDKRMANGHGGGR